MFRMDGLANQESFDCQTTAKWELPRPGQTKCIDFELYLAWSGEYSSFHESYRWCSNVKTWTSWDNRKFHPKCLTFQIFLATQEWFDMNSRWILEFSWIVWPAGGWTLFDWILPVRLLTVQPLPSPGLFSFIMILIDLWNASKKLRKMSIVVFMK